MRVVSISLNGGGLRLKGGLEKYGNLCKSGNLYESECENGMAREVMEEGIL